MRIKKMVPSLQSFDCSTNSPCQYQPAERRVWRIWMLMLGCKGLTRSMITLTWWVAPNWLPLEKNSVHLHILHENAPLCKRLHQILLKPQRDGIELQSQHLRKKKSQLINFWYVTRRCMFQDQIILSKSLRLTLKLPRTDS